MLHVEHTLYYAAINVSPHLLGEVRQSWGFDLIKIQLPHPPGNGRIQILTGQALRAFRMRTLAIYFFPTPGASLPFQTRKIPHPLPGGGEGGG